MDEVFLMMGPLHIEQVCLKMHGQLIEGTGLYELLNVAKLRPDNPGAAVVSAAFITRAQYVMQVELVTMHNL